ncbi:MAG: MarP family serine protease [Actinomycetota bacterium]|nr:MarP family serine protease [Actinomycetota bacterium]
MTAVDWIILGFALLMAVWGYAQGLIVGGLSLLGFAAGGFLGSRVGPMLLSEGSRSPYAPLFALMGALLVGSLLATALEVLGFRLRGRLGGKVGALDGLGGALLVAAIGLGLVWLAGAVALNTPGARQLREPIQRSLILQRLNAALPPSGPLLKTLARFDPFPGIRGPKPEVRRPDPAIARDQQVRAARRSVVRVLGTACGLGVQGSGWVAQGGLVVTNAHVVAGQEDTTVQIEGGGRRLDAQAVHYDPINDLAILRVPATEGVPALRLDAAARPGAAAAILGFPGNGDYRVAAGRLAETRSFRTRDAYGRGPISRRITLVRGHVQSGDSGGPVVDGDGEVVTTTFAASVGSVGGRSGYGVPDSIVARALDRVGGPVGTGPCAE